MMTCPVILMQFLKLYKTYGQTLKQEVENFVIIVDQIMIVTGAFGAVSRGVTKWIFFVVALAAGAGLFSTMFMLTIENLPRFKPKARFSLKITAGLFLISWASFPALWILGSPGLNILSQGLDVTLHCIADFLSKNCFGAAAWYVRWHAVVENGNEGNALTKRDMLSRKLRKQSGGKGKLNILFLI